MSSRLVGIAGGSGSGKTTVARALAASFTPEQVEVIPLDAYYKDRQGVPLDERARINYDHPDAFDEDLLLAHLQALRAGKPVDVPRYDYARHERRPQSHRVEPKPVVLVEGILVLALPRVRTVLDLKLYVETAADVRFLRRMRRDVAERGRTVESVMDQYLDSVRPMHDAFIEPSRHHADLIVPGEGRFEVALDVLRAWGASLLR